MQKQDCSIHQLAANRANAEKSTGPRTEAGKEASSRNATRHALAGHQFALRYDESEEEYQHVLQDLIDQHRPANTTEDILVLKIAQAYWLGQRAIRIGSSDMGDLKQMALMMRYQGLHDRAFQSSLKQLRELQKARIEEDRQNSNSAQLMKAVTLNTKLVRFELLRAKHESLIARQQLDDASEELNRQIADLTAGMNIDEDVEQDLLDDLAA